MIAKAIDNYSPSAALCQTINERRASVCVCVRGGCGVDVCVRDLILLEF